MKDRINEMRRIMNTVGTPSISNKPMGLHTTDETMNEAKYSFIKQKDFNSFEADIGKLVKKYWDSGCTIDDFIGSIERYVSKPFNKT